MNGGASSADLRRDPWLVAIAVGAFLLRLGWAGVAGVFSHGAADLQGDEGSYVELAQELRHDPVRFLFDDERSLLRFPGQIAYLAAFGGSLAAPRLLNILWSTASVVLAMLLAGWSEGRRAARLAGLAVAMSPQLIAAASSLATETPFTALLLSGVASLVCAVGGTRRSAACAALAGVAFGIASLFRPLALVVAPAIAVVATAGVLIDRHRLDGWRRAAWIAVAVSACVVLPVMVKNGVRFGRFGIANGLGAVMYLGAHPETGGDDPWALGVALSWPPCAGDHHASDCDRVLLRQAVEWIRADPAEFVARIPVKIHRAWIGNQREVFHPARGLRDTTGLNWRGVTWRIASIVCAALLAGAFLWTLARGDWRLDPSSLAVVLTVAVLTLVSALTFAIPRFGEPLLPCFAIAAAIAAARPGRLWPGWVLGAALALCTFLGP